MVIIGAGGHAKELLELLTEGKEEIIFFDNTVCPQIKEVFGSCQLINSWEQLETFFQSKPNFALGIGNYNAPLKLDKKVTQNKVIKITL